MANTPGSPSYHRRRSSSIFRIARDVDPQGKSSAALKHHHSKEQEHAGSAMNGTGHDHEDKDDDYHWAEDDDDDNDEGAGLTHPSHSSHPQAHARFDDDEPSSSTRPLNANYTPTSLPLTHPSTLRNLAINGALIALWYSFSISISVYNKWMFSAENLDFHFPLFTTSAHMIVQFLCASLTLWLFPRFRPQRPSSSLGQYTSLSSPNHHSSSGSSKREPLMTTTFYLTRVGPCGTATALDIGLGNFSLRFITLTFFTMCKSSVLAFVLVFAFLFRLEEPTWRLCGVIGVMTAGVVMMVAGETAFDLLGFGLVMTASLCSGFRWSLTQILLLRHPATRTPFSSIFFLTPVMFVALFVLAVAIEGFPALAEGVGKLAAEHGSAYSVVIMLFPGLLAFLMVAAEFTLIQRTSVVTLSVCGIFKEVLTISAASVAFGDPLSPINVSGLVVTIVSIAGYNWLKISKAKEAQAREATQQMLEMDDMSTRPGIEKIDRASARGRGSADGLTPDHFVLDTDDDEDYDGKQVNGVLENGRATVYRKKPPYVE